MMLLSTTPPQGDTLGAFAPLLGMMGLALLIALLLNLWHFYDFDRGEQRRPPPPPLRHRRRPPARPPDAAAISPEVSALVQLPADDAPALPRRPARQTPPRTARGRRLPARNRRADPQTPLDP